MVIHKRQTERIVRAVILTVFTQWEGVELVRDSLGDL